MHNIEVKRINIMEGLRRQDWLDLLQKNELTAESSVDKVFGVFKQDTLIASGGRFGNILKMIAVAPAYRGGPVFNLLLDELLKDAFLNGFSKLFVYTKPDTKLAFETLGFRELVTYKNRITFMERGHPSFDDYLTLLGKKALPAGTTGAVVMHANPFTRGHLHLIEAALLSCDLVYAFVLSEDRGAFPPSVRRQLVEAGVGHLNAEKTRVITLPTDDYLVSSQTFPAYFLSDNDEAITLQAGIDAMLFKQAIAPLLRLSYRYVGEEPRSHVTNLYNAALAETLTTNPLLRIIPRLEFKGKVISASRVRKMWLDGKTEAIRPLVPPSTFNYLLATRPQKTSS